ncbi:flagellar hook-associated protein FlgK [Yoonia sp. MH D7]
MSISSALNNAISGLTATSRTAEVVSSNLSNALTEGYGRRQLETSSANGGVRVDGISRNVDKGLTGDRRLAEARLNAEQRTLDMLSKVESLLGIPGDPDGLAGQLASFEQALISAASDPASDQRLSVANTTLKRLVSSLNDGSAAVQVMRQSADAAIVRDVSTLNTSLRMLETLNADITRAKSVGQDPSNLFDARQQVVDEIGGIIPVRELDRGNGQIGLMTTSGLILIDGTFTEFEFNPTPTITPDMTLALGGLSGITRGGISLSDDNGFGRLLGGSLEAAFKLRDETLVATQQGLDDIALDLITRFSDTSVDPTTGGTGLLTDAGNPADPADFIGLSSRIAVNSSVDPAQGGDLSKWRDGVSATSSGPTVNAAQLDRWHRALTGDLGPISMSAAERISLVSSSASQDRVSAERQLSFTSARWDSLHNAELAGGVDSDVELQILLRVEQAYAANAKVIQTVSAMIQQLMEI